MKKVAFMFMLATGLVACKQKPSAGMNISSSTIKVGETIEVSNTSGNCDISLINIEGEGVYNNAVKVHDSFESTDKTFRFTYTKPGVYIVRVKAENTSFFTGTEYATEEKTITVLPLN